ncbi:dienelactone hydrolase family protein [Sphingobium sp. CFD-1]|uniref:dienelactone hydrolase family protein n=1 Tax=Sphingobium sp. CFD-1 TaxID=2878545 RepID=UPI00214B6090|nr:dienelactone hydrolase family protein [Sphingobium sp. CFD-1]
MSGTSVSYTDSEGVAFTGYLARPAKPNGAGVLIAHNAPGLDDHERDIADRLAGLGYVALAADYHGDGAILGGEALGARMEMFTADPAPMRRILGAALARLVSEPDVMADRVAAIGYCFGGFGALELARGGARLASTVGFHALLPSQRDEDAANIKGHVLVCNATMDPYVSIDSRIAFEKVMDAAGIDWRMILYGGTQHAFTIENADKIDMPGIAYHPANAQRSWQAMLDLFAETIDRKD